MPSNIWNVVNNDRDTHQYKNNSVDMFFQAIDFERNKHLHGRTEEEGKSMRPQDRPELNPIDYRFP